MHLHIHTHHSLCSLLHTRAFLNKKEKIQIRKCCFRVKSQYLYSIFFLIGCCHLFKSPLLFELFVSNFLIPLPMSQSSQTACQLILFCPMSATVEQLLMGSAFCLLSYIYDTLLMWICVSETQTIRSHHVTLTFKQKALGLHVVGPNSS